MNSATEEVYVLSLPGFFFTKALKSAGATQRALTSCVLVGRRQMLSIGGGDGFKGYPDSLLDRDPCSNGLCIFDVTRMVWTDEYDSEARPYESPTAIKQWYERDGMRSVVWSSSEVERIFSSEPAPVPKSDEQATVPLAEILGGALGGSVGFIMILLVLGCFYWKRKKKRLGLNATLSIRRRAFASNGN
ncbi:hypothetical protein B0T14DRAFT_517593 [Immersiella caudata]|uniref:Uncharacterized protein n=1 Tax=Immersiella caudata TaxID=314043 RepID=A0AA39WYV1_9PEZI|nr:hypothetical protein B0T14DRAFT_517593 [Immersiella caudata]